MEKKHRAPGTMQLGDANKQGGRGWGGAQVWSYVN